MNIELINKILIETADLVGQVNDTEAMRGKLLKKLTTVTVMLNEKAPPGGSLLAHLTSLTVAERETILRISDLVAQTWCYDEYASDKDRVFNAIQLVRDVEAELRTPI